jgi:hypothetical protein
MDKIQLKPEHLVATFLDPHFRQFLFVGNEVIRAEKLGEARDFLIVKMRAFARHQIGAPAQSADIRSDFGCGETVPSAPKKKKLSLLDQARSVASNSPANANLVEEIDRYLLCDVPKSKNPLDFWRTFKEKLPHLAAVACMLYAITASSAPSERNFSAAGRVIEARRTRLNPFTVDCLLRVRSFIMNKNHAEKMDD